MPVIIENIGGNPNGKSNYLLRINGKKIANFSHNRPDGLSQCLKEAYKAAQKVEAKERGAKLKRLRNEVGLTLREIGRLSRVSISYISDIECGRKPFGKVGQNIETILRGKQLGHLIDTN